ncbi:MAG TPA: hypothetical protein VGQ83_17635 [Polyangia bacterium]|jgi:hypothetical protein
MPKVLIVAVLLALGCGKEVPVGGSPPVSSTNPTQTFPDSGNKLDLLFVIDNSASMDPKQETLRKYFPHFMEPLNGLVNGTDLHIGIVTSDLGGGQFTPASCATLGGDQGALQNTPKGETCAGAHLNDPNERFLAYRADNDGVATNFTGTIGDAFACYAAVGESGCGFEQQLASAQAALAGCTVAGGCAQPANEGFLRPDAFLAVIIITDEDDCSAPADTTLFSPLHTSMDSALGPLTSYRCFEFGTVCGGQPPGRAVTATLTDCVPGSWDPDPQHQLTPVEDLAGFFKALKPDPRWVYVAVIAGPPAPPTINPDSGRFPLVQASCTAADPSWQGTPALRLSQFTGLFDTDRARFINVCDFADHQVELGNVALELSTMLGRRCLAAPLADLDAAAPGLQPSCVVQERTLVDGAYVARAVPPCDPVVCDPATAPGGRCECRSHAQQAPGCWYVWQDAQACPDSEASGVTGGFAIRVDRGVDDTCTSPPPPADTELVVQCESCAADPAHDSYDCSPACAGYWPRCCPTPTPGCAR